MPEPPRGPPVSPAGSGVKFAHYRIEALLGRGGMGEVFRATDTRLGRPVAIKIMRPERLAEDDTATRRFLREARAASALNHPNIVTVHQIDATDEGDQYLVQELIDGRTLRELVDDGPVAVDRVCEIGRQVAHALAAAHDAGIVHRDIKPENVMVRADGYVKILDFGLARLMRGLDGTAAGASTFETQEGSLTGTPAYMSPEQASEESVGSPTDVWSLGVMLYELLAGEPPFVGRTPVHVIAAVLTGHPPPLDAVRSDAPRGLVDAVHRMLDKRPDGRPTAREIEGLLTDVIAGGGRLAAPAIPTRQRLTVGR